MHDDTGETGRTSLPELLIRSLDFAKIEALQMEGDWNSAGVILNNEAKALERGGADVIVLATNTMHKLASEMMTGVKIPFVHIADATAQAIKTKGLRNPGLMATAFTMEQSFYTDRLIASGLSPISQMNPTERKHIGSFTRSFART